MIIPEKEAIVTGFTFTIEDLKSAPVEVRRWLAGRIEGGLLTLMSAAPTSPPIPAPSLAACTPREVVGIFELLKGDFAATHVLLELARDEPDGDTAAQIHLVNIGVLMRNTRLDDHRLVSCLRTISRAFQEVRQDPDAMLFGFDQANQIYLHETTYRSIHSLWQELVGQHAPAETTAAAPIEWPPTGFQAHQPGSSERIGTQEQR
jgi:hypothetical protein